MAPRHPDHHHTHDRRSSIRRFLESEAAGGLLLMAVAILAIVVANSPLADGYQHLLHLSVGPLSLQHWINDGLMAVFFLMVGLEIKREMIEGELSSWSRRLLPGVAALGGMVAPALVFMAFNAGDATTARGWAIPMATDIAFALGVMALLGRRVPPALKIFLAALAIIDDLGAVLVIALFYTNAFNLPALGGAALVTALLVALNLLGVRRLLPYLAAGLLLWVLVLQSGLHATLAGVIVALTVPLKPAPLAPASSGASAFRPDRPAPGHALPVRPDLAHGSEAGETAIKSAPQTGDGHHLAPLLRLEHALARPVAFVVVPIFGFANAGLSFSALTPASFAEPLTLGVAAGLLAGKVIGVFGAVWLMVRAGFAHLPAATGWSQLFGLSLLCGIGFTMSLFISLLAFDDAQLLDQVKLGILTGSLLAGLAGYAVLRGARR